MEKVFIITKGSYFNYHICGVFSNRNLAEMFIKTINGKGITINEWGLNSFKIEINKGYKPYFVRMSKDGEVLEIEITDDTYWFADSSETTGFDLYNNFFIHCFAKNPKHAIKIANKYRLDILISNLWGGKWEDIINRLRRRKR